MSTADYIVLGIIFICTVLAVISIIGSRKNGSCCGKCSNGGKCASHDRETHR